MEANWAEYLGYLAALLTTTAFAPQVWRTWRTRHTADISLAMYVLFCAGIAAWLGYGLAVGSRPVVATNAATLVLALAVLVMKLRFR